MTVTVIDEGARTIDGELVGGRVIVGATGLREALGWELKPEGLCRAEVCVPLPAAAKAGADGKVDLDTAARAIGRPSVVDAELGVVAIALPSEGRARALDGLEAAPFTLPDLDGAPHSLAEWHGHKRLLIAFSSW